MNENLQASYDASVDYHNTLVQSRFSVASLYMTAAAFLIAAYFSDISKWNGYSILIPLLGVVLTLTSWLLEMRTEALLANLVDIGVGMEVELSISENFGFFQLMSKPQPKGIRFPFIRCRISNDSRVIRYVCSHTFGLEIMYFSFLSFWLNAAWLAK